VHAFESGAKARFGQAKIGTGIDPLLDFSFVSAKAKAPFYS